MTLLSDFVVVELAGVLAGPSAGSFLAELGAKVVKFENRNTGGDVTRNWRVPGEDLDSISAYYSAANFGKDVEFIDLKNEADLLKIKSTIAQADVLIVNFKSGDAEKYGLTPELLQTENPGLIYAKLGGFRYDVDRTAFDVVIQAETGFMAMNGTSQSGPIKLPVAFMDLFAAHQLKEGILAGIIHRYQSGKGCVVETTLEECGISALANQATNWLMANHLPQRMGSLHPNIAPYGETLTCADQLEVVLAIGSNAQFENLLALLGLEGALNDERFKTNPMRLKYRDELFELLQSAFQKVNREDVLSRAKALQIPMGAIRTLDEVFTTEAAQKLILTEEIEGAKTSRVAQKAFRIIPLG